MRLAPRIELDFSPGHASQCEAADRLSLRMLPRDHHVPAVFGDGSHPTTRLCAATLDTLMCLRPIEAVLDVGTGNAILARIARARGATLIEATDIDAAARQSAAAHASLDESPVAITISAAAPAQWVRRFDLAVANILEAPLLELAAEIVASVKPGGLILLSGITRTQVPALRVGYEQFGARALSVTSLEGWAGVVLERCVDHAMDRTA